MNRVLIIDKPKGFTSHDVVARVRRVTRIKKVGHTGTLDPDATGVLIVLIGKATRLAEFFVGLEKHYRGRVVLGVSTDTEDAAGKILSTRDASAITPDQIEEAFAHFEGDSEQVPPMVSALKREGTPLYVLARRGEVVEREARPITISGLKVLSIEMPEVEFEMGCSRGTYVRTLAADIGERLGCGGHLGELARTAVGRLTLDSAVSLSEVDQAGRAAVELGLSMFEALSFMPEVRISDIEEEIISTGGAIEVATERVEVGAELVRLSQDGEELVAVGKVVDANGEPEDEPPSGVTRVRPIRVFVDPY